MSTFIDGVGQCQVVDKSGELVDLKGHDITSLDKTGTVTWEHQNGSPATLVGKILKSKKIFSKDECSSDSELYWWNECKIPYLYIMAELLDDYTASARECAGQLLYSKNNPDKENLLGFSIEGSEIPNTRKGTVITRSIARKVTLTQQPCNSMCKVRIIDNPNELSTVKDDFEELFKTEAKAIEMFKSEEGHRMYETFLAKKESKSECLLHKSAPWSSGKISGDSVHYSHPEHGTVSIQKQPSGEFHVKHNGALAGVGGTKGSFGSSKEAGSHAKKYMNAVSNNKIFSNSLHNHPSPSMMGKTELKKTLTAGSSNAAPSTLVNGSAYQSESLKKPKKDWNKQAKNDYENWPQKDKFEKFMSARMPHLQLGEIKAFGRALALKKSIDFEKALKDLTSKK